MRKHEELSDPTSCLNKAEDQEPIFVLLGRDPAAVATISFWTQERVRLGCEKSYEDPKIVSAYALAEKMTMYRKAFSRPPEQREAAEQQPARTAQSANKKTGKRKQR